MLQLSSYGAYYLTNQTHYHQDCFAFTQNDTNQALSMQNRFGHHPILPPIAHQLDPLHLQQQNALMEYHNRQMYLPQTHVNASFKQTNYQSNEISNKRHLTMQIKQPPLKSFISPKTAIEYAQQAVSRLYQDSITTPDMLLNQIMFTTAYRHNEATLHVSQKTSLIFDKLFQLSYK